MTQKIKIENFGKVRPHQSWALNDQLNEHLKEFDKQYELLGGRVGSLAHQQDRMDFARIAGEGMLKLFNDDQHIITALKSETSFSCGNLQADIYVSTYSEFSYGKQKILPPSLS